MSQPDHPPPPSGWGPPPGAGGPYGPPPTTQYATAGPVYLDQASGLMLPQGTQLASPGRRIGAYFLNILLFIMTLGIGFVIWGLVAWGRGQTPAYQVLSMRCYRPGEGRVAGWGWMALREIVGQIVEGVLGIITSVISFVLFLSRSDRRSLKDLIAGTVVLHDPNKVMA